MGSISPHSTAKALRWTFICVAAGAAMAVSAVAGAWMQSQFDARPGASGTERALLTEQSRHDADYIRQNIGLLASKVGDLKAQLIAMDGLSRRVADAAGVSYTDPEIYAGLEESVNEAGLLPETPALEGLTAETLGRELDSLERELVASKERFGLLDAVLTRRAGVKESLPSFKPVNHPHLSSSYGWRRHPISGRHTMHEGLDFAAPRGAPIHAASAGVVTEARYVPGYGKMVEINHGNGLVTRYAHASSISVKLGELVSRGQQIARVGSTGRSTGAHLHFEVRIAGHPLDPLLFLEDAQPPTDELALATNIDAAANSVELR